MRGILVRLLCALLVSLGLIGCRDLLPRGADQTPTSVPTPTNEECAVYNGFLESFPEDQEKPEVTLVILKQPFLTGFMKDKGLLERMLPVAKQQLGQAVDPETWDDFRVKSESDSDLDANCFAGRRYRSILIAADDLDEIFKTSPDSGWEEFYKRFPGTNGYLQLSHVGFNASKDKALVYVGMSSGPLAGAGGIMLLHEEGSSWIVDAGATLWMS